MATDKKSQIKEDLAQAKAELTELLNSLTEEQWQTTIFSEGDSWTVRDVVAHLVDAEPGLSIHIHKIQRGKETIPENFNIDKWNAGVKERMAGRTPAELLQGLDEVRAKTLEKLETVQDDEWQLTGRHPTAGVQTIEQYYGIISNHQRQHAADIKRGLGMS